MGLTFDELRIVETITRRRNSVLPRRDWGKERKEKRKENLSPVRTTTLRYLGVGVLDVKAAHPKFAVFSLAPRTPHILSIDFTDWIVFGVTKDFLHFPAAFYDSTANDTRRNLRHRGLN